MDSNVWGWNLALGCQGWQDLRQHPLRWHLSRLQHDVTQEAVKT